jgi:large subunit ribosomal protein L4e
MKVKVKDVTTTVTQAEIEAGRMHAMIDVEVSEGKAISLPDAFATPVREDLIKLAVASSRANRRQAYGSRAHVGKGRGVSRIMRRPGSRRAAQNPHTLGGRRAHGPKVERDWSRKLNQKERRLARDSALSATTDIETVTGRGHRVDDGVESLPIVLGTYTEIVDGTKTSYDIEAFNHGSATRKAKAMLEALGLGADLQRASDGRKIRAGKGTMRGRVHKTPRSVLLVVAKKEGLAQAVRNLPGVDVVAVKDLSAEDLAPGGDVGRLTVFTSSAVEAMN